MAKQDDWPRDNVKVRPPQKDQIKQGIGGLQGINEGTTPSRGLSLLVTDLPPGGQSLAHYHEEFESGIYIVEGEVQHFYGDELEYDVLLSPGDFIYIPPYSPHKTFNRSRKNQGVGVTARNDPFEQERVTLLPHLDDGRCDSRVSYVD